MTVVALTKSRKISIPGFRDRDCMNPGIPGSRNWFQDAANLLKVFTENIVSNKLKAVTSLNGGSERENIETEYFN